MADKGKGKMTEEESSSNTSPSRMDTMLAFVDEKERRRTDNEREEYEVHRDKRCLCAECFVPMEICKQGSQQLKKDRQYYDQLNKQIKKSRKPCPAVKRQRAAGQLLQLAAPAPKRRRAAAQLLRPAPQPVPDNIRDAIREIGGVDIMWVSENVVTKSDIKKSQNRLRLPSDCYDFLQSIMTDDEKIKLFESHGQRLHIKLVDQNQKFWDMDLRYWPATQWRVFTGNWNKFVESWVLDLVPEMAKVQIWCFRVPAQDMRLCFAINIVRPPAPEAAPEAAPGSEPEEAP